MKPFVLRRLKQDVLQDLPKKTDSVIHVPMTPTQKERYEELVDTFQNASKDVKVKLLVIKVLRKKSKLKVYIYIYNHNSSNMWC